MQPRKVTPPTTTRANTAQVYSGVCLGCATTRRVLTQVNYLGSRDWVDQHPVSSSQPGDSGEFWRSFRHRSLEECSHPLGRGPLSDAS